VGLGAILNWMTESPAPMSTLPMLWLLCLAWIMERILFDTDRSPSTGF
jgi:hypothetical protein